jgi:2-oxo-3-hexenedioate decarboxylase
LCEHGRGSNALGSALLAVAHLTAVLSTQPKALPLQAGEIVTTGTLTAALPIYEGQIWSTNLEGISLPGISLSVES